MTVDYADRLVQRILSMVQSKRELKLTMVEMMWLSSVKRCDSVERHERIG